ncbi:hypothetical protein CsSME_00037955 [Camellia sinensis var. sinensis]
MDKRKKIVSYLNKGVEVSTQLLVEKHLPLFILPLTLVVWVIEKWVFSFSNWVPLVVTVWATIQPGTPLEHCEWLNKLSMEIWPNYIHPKLSTRFSSIVEDIHLREGELIYLHGSVWCSC